MLTVAIIKNIVNKSEANLVHLTISEIFKALKIISILV